ncbi:MAG: hypothetical protein EOO40_09630 [Deltaproteobacteria bacterium]|nr:MAG: hypothetical protein EOO40_09630 [Deltaproteobacteria bacterium]
MGVLHHRLPGARPRPRTWEAMVQNTQQLQRLRARVMPNSRTELRRLGRRHWQPHRRASWAGYFAAFYRLDSEWCHFVVTQMLHPEPAARPTALQVWQFAHSQRAQQHDAGAIVLQAMQDVSRRNLPAQRAIVQLKMQREAMLQAYRETADGARGRHLGAARGTP